MQEEQAPSSEQPAAGPAASELVQDADEVMKCLKRAIKWAHAAQQQVCRSCFRTCLRSWAGHVLQSATGQPGAGLSTIWL